MYQTIVRNKEQGYEAVNYSTTKHEAIRFIADEMSVSQVSIKDEIGAREDSTVYRDSIGFRAVIKFDNGDWKLED